MKVFAHIVLMAALAVSFVAPAYAQESLWNELNAKAHTLYQQGQYSEAATVAEEALKVAERTFGQIGRASCRERV